MSINRKSLSDVRLTPERTIPAEPIKVEYINGEYVALLAEAPLSVQTTTVVLDGTQRIYTTSQTPTVGTYSIKKHSNKFIPILLFHESDNNLTGTCDYYKTGTILCAAHWEADHEFLKPLVTDYSTVEELAGNIPPTTDFNTFIRIIGGLASGIIPATPVNFSSFINTDTTKYPQQTTGINYKQESLTKHVKAISSASYKQNPGDKYPKGVNAFYKRDV